MLVYFVGNAGICLEKEAERDDSFNSEGSLTDDEIKILEIPEDIRILERIKQMSNSELESYQIFVPVSQRDYLELQREWIDKSFYLLGTVLHRCPSEMEGFLYYAQQNSLRFRAFYALKFPDRVVDASSNRKVG